MIWRRSGKSDFGAGAFDELIFGDDFYAELFGFGEFAAGVGAGDEEAGFLAHAARQRGRRA